MREVLDELETWWMAGSAVAPATVVGAFRSAPRQPGAAMLIGPGGEAVGSVSGGCEEGAVYEVGTGVRDGGTLDLFVERVDARSFPQLGQVAAAVREHEPVAVATVIAGPASRVGRRLAVWADRVEGRTGLQRLDHADGQRRGDGLPVFVESYSPPPRMIVFGAIDFAAAMAPSAPTSGTRSRCATPGRCSRPPPGSPQAREVVVEWPHRYLAAEAAAGRVDGRTAICVLTHDPKFDVPLLEVALRLPAVGYIGAMGSRRTHDDRLQRLRESGLSPDALARMPSPIGLDIGARTPEKTAVSLAAEMIAQRWGGLVTRLSDRAGRSTPHPPVGGKRW